MKNRRQSGPKITEKHSKNRLKIDKKSSQNHPQGRLGAAWGRLEASWGLGYRLEGVLEPSWSHLGSVLGRPWGVLGALGSS